MLSSLIVLVIKNDGSIWSCVDNRWVNDVSQFIGYPKPQVDELLDQLGTSFYNTVFDQATALPATYLDDMIVT